jgi:hypothetical protein
MLDASIDCVHSHGNRASGICSVFSSRLDHIESATVLSFGRYFRGMASRKVHEMKSVLHSRAIFSGEVVEHCHAESRQSVSAGIL